MKVEFSLLSRMDDPGMISPITPSTIKASFPPLDPVQTKKAEDIKAVLQQTLDTLKNSKSEISDQRKAMAAERVARIKAAIKALKQTPGMDPQAMAKMVARLAKELASAVKAYKAAGGTDAAVASGGAAPATPTASASNPQASTEVTAAVETEMPVDYSTPSEAADPQATQQMAMGVKAYQQTQTNTSGKKSGKEQDDAFIKDARDVLEELKFMAKLQKIRIKIKKEDALIGDFDPSMRDIRVIEKAVDEAEKALTQIARQNMSAQSL
jgi:hypothetical protein